MATTRKTIGFIRAVNLTIRVMQSFIDKYRADVKSVRVCGGANHLKKGDSMVFALLSNLTQVSFLNRFAVPVYKCRASGFKLMRQTFLGLRVAASEEAS